MILHNDNGLPLPLLIWLLTDEYNHDNRENLISVTSLLNPLQEVILSRKYKLNEKELSEVLFQLPSRIGTAIHNSIQSSNENKENVKNILKEIGYDDWIINDHIDNIKTEIRSEKQVGKYIISGQFDMVYNNRIIDIKTVSAYSFMYKNIDNYIWQLSAYKWLNQELIKDNIGSIYYIITDWNKLEAIKNKDYPQSKIIIENYELMSTQLVDLTINEAIKILTESESKNDNELVECTDSERWKENDIYAFYKDINQPRSTKNFDNEYDAKEYMKNNFTPNSYIERRIGKNKKCESFCRVKNLCQQYKKIKEMEIL